MRDHLAEPLRAYLDAAGDAPMAWGISDCSRWAAGWVALVHGRPVDLPRWTSREEAHGLIREAGSLAALWADALFAFGLDEAGVPDAGDVGIIDTGRFGQVGGIFLSGGYFAWRAEPRGILILLPRSIVRVWSIR
ncbi:DUF6950 family protein [Shinella zoogloeoides]|uniref:DUF6950 family protein n=1 Tax=Shinella zoogloeoides TaxID=352475 RepID=UPI00273D0334|nr:hypothetical protein [Shinella zoogloeoides]WLR92184.1 hypothetical protein Q9316_17210 [Shinella zoogloeoides]